MISNLKRASKRSLAVLLALLMIVSTLAVGTFTATAATATTVYYAVSTNYTVKCNVNFKGDGDDWHQYDMSSTGKTFNGVPVYSVSFTDAYNGLGVLQFQLYDGGTWKDEVQPISSWTSASVYNGKIWANNSWQTYTPDSTEQSWYVAGSAGLTGSSWEVNDTANKMTLSGSVYTKTYEGIAAGDYEFKITNGTWDEAYPSNNYQLKVNADNSTVTITFNSSTKDINVSQEAQAVVFKAKKFTNTYVMVNALTATSPAQGTKGDGDVNAWNYVTDMTQIRANDIGCAKYVPMAILTPSNGGTALYIYGSAVDAAALGGDGTTMPIGKLKEDKYSVDMRILGFDSEAHATAFLSAQKSFDSITYSNYHNTTQPLGTLADEAGSVSDATYGKVSYSNLVSNGDVLVASNGETLSTFDANTTVNGNTGTVYGAYNAKITVTAFTNKGLGTFKTNAYDIDALSDKVKFECKYYYSVNDGQAVLAKTASSDNNVTNGKKPFATKDYSLDLSKVKGLKSGDKVKIYTTMQAFYYADETSEGVAITDVVESDVVTYDTDDVAMKQNYINENGGTSLWADADDSAFSSNTLVKWNSRRGENYNRGSSPEVHVFYLSPKTNLSAIRFYYSASQISSVKVNGNTITSGAVYTGGFNTSTTYTFNVTPKSGSAYTRNVKFMKGSTSSAQIYLNTALDPTSVPEGITYNSNDLFDCQTTEKDKATVMKYKDVTWKGTTVAVDGDKVYGETALKKIKGRGNSSWENSTNFYGKYAYNMTIGADNYLGLAGNGKKNKKFCLLANVLDPTQARNAYIFKLAQEMGMEYTPNFRLVDLYDNGWYVGSYLITQKVELGADALVDATEVSNKKADKNLDKVETVSTYKNKTIAYMSNLTTPADYQSGTYMLELDLADRAKAEISYFESAKGQYIVVTSPEEASETEVKFLKDKWDTVETAVYNGNLDSVRDMIDTESFAKMYLVQELSKNLDSGATSYDIIYKGAEGKFYAEPVWDYDWALGNYRYSKAIHGSHTYANADPSSASGYLARYKSMSTDSTDDANAYNFQAALCQNNSFWTDVQNVWTNGFSAKATSVKDSFLTEFTNNNADSINMNEYRWCHIANNYELSGEWGTTNTGSTYSAAVSSLKSFITNRVSYFNSGSTGIAATGTTTNRTLGVGVTAGSKATAKAAGFSLEATSATAVTKSIPSDTWVTFTTDGSTDTTAFKGWFTNAAGTGTAVSTDTSYKVKVTSNTTLYAVYEQVVTDRTVKITYKFHDFDTSQGLEYADGREKEEFETFTVTETVSAEDYATEDYIETLAMVDMPEIKSSYYNYNFPENDEDIVIEENGSNVNVTVTLENAMRRYVVYLWSSENSNEMILSQTKECHYNEEVTYDAADAGCESEHDDGYIWHFGTKSYNPDKDTPLSLGKTYKFRVVNEVTHIFVEANEDYYDELASKKPSTGITHVYSEATPESVEQNFYIQANISKEDKNAGKFVGTGVVYYLWDDEADQANAAAVRDLGTVDKNTIKAQIAAQADTLAGLTETKSQITGFNNVKGLVCCNYKKGEGETDAEGLLRYSGNNEYYNLIVGLKMAANSDYSKYSYRVYSYAIYQNDEGENTVVVSPTFAEAKVFG